MTISERNVSYMYFFQCLHLSQTMICNMQNSPALLWGAWAHYHPKSTHFPRIYEYMCTRMEVFVPWNFMRYWISLKGNSCLLIYVVWECETGWVVEKFHLSRNLRLQVLVFCLWGCGTYILACVWSTGRVCRK